MAAQSRHPRGKQDQSAKPPDLFSAGDELTFEAWQGFHGRLFGLCTQSHAETILAIARVLRSGGFEPADLYEASRWMALNNPPTYPSEHLPRLHARLREIAYMRQRSKREEIARQRAAQERETALRGKAVREMIAEARKKGVIPCS